MRIIAPLSTSPRETPRRPAYNDGIRFPRRTRMNDVVPFTLKVAGKDQFQGGKAVSTSYKLRGLLRFDGASLWIEWTGTYRVQEVGALTARDEEAPLPVESLTGPLARGLNARFRGG